VTPNVDTAEPPANLTDKLSTLLISEEGNSRFLGKALLESPASLLIGGQELRLDSHSFRPKDFSGFLRELEVMSYRNPYQE
jgi:hypothetical protein